MNELLKMLKSIKGLQSEIKKLKRGFSTTRRIKRELAEIKQDMKVIEVPKNWDLLVKKMVKDAFIKTDEELDNK